MEINTSLAQAYPRPAEFLRGLKPENGVELYKRAYDKGMSLSAYLEREYPEREQKDGLDAFQRLLMLSDIRTRSLPEAGVYASLFKEMLDDPSARCLVPEFIAREWRRAAVGAPVMKRAVYTSQDSGAGTAANQIAFATTARLSEQIAPAIPLSELVAINTPIDTGVYQAFYLTNDTSKQHMARVAEGAEIPRLMLQGSDREIRVKKYGRVLEATYESLRRQRIDRIALTIQLMAVQAEVDKVGAVIDVLVGGDGNANTAATSYNLTTLDPAAAAGTLTLRGWLAFKMKFKNPYMINIALTREATALQMMLLNVGSANVPLVFLQGPSGFGGFRQINPGLADNVGLGWTDDAPNLKIVGVDGRFAIERVFEIGASIEEVQNVITRQVKQIAMTESEGFSKFDVNAARVLDVNA